MTKQIVMQHLKAYRSALGRCAHLRVEIEQIKAAREGTRTDMIDAMNFGPKGEPGMPHGTGVADPTPRIADALVMDGHVGNMDARIRSAQIALGHTMTTVKFVEGWLRCLNAREKFVFKRQVIDEIPWRIIADDYRAAYGEHASKDTLKRIRDRALDKIYQAAQ